MSVCVCPNVLYRRSRLLDTLIYLFERSIKDFGIDFSRPRFISFIEKLARFLGRNISGALDEVIYPLKFCTYFIHCKSLKEIPWNTVNTFFKEGLIAVVQYPYTSF